MNKIQDIKALDFAVEMTLNRHKEERKRTEDLNNRANKLIGYAVALGSLYYGLVSAKLPENKTLSIITGSPFLLEIIVVLISLSVNNIFLTSRFLTGPGGEILKKYAREMSEIEFKYKILDIYSNAYDRGYKENIKSSKKLKYASFFLGIGFVLGFIGIIISQLCK